MGVFKRTVLRSQTFMREEGYRSSLTPDAGCREANWKSVQSLLRLLPLDSVRVFATIGGVRTPIFFGELRQGGNVQDVEGEQCVLRGLNTRFREVPMVAGAYSTRDAGFLMRDALRDAIAAGWFGTPSLITVADADFPALNFTLDVKATYQQNLQALLDRILEQSGQSAILECGVRPNGSAYLKVKKANDLNDIRVMPPSTPINAQVPVQEVVYTQVLWFIEQRPDGGWVTHLSEHPSKAQYGPRQTEKQLDAATVKPYTVAPFTAVANDGTGQVTLSEAQKASLIDEGGPPTIAAPNALSLVAETDSADVYLTQTLTSGATRYELRVHWVNGDVTKNKVVITRPPVSGQPGEITTLMSTDLKAQTISAPTDPGVTPGSAGSVALNATFAPTLLYDLPPGTVISIQGGSLPTADANRRRVLLTIGEARPDRPDAALLGRMALAHIQTPVLEPGRLNVPQLLDPATLQGHAQSGSYVRAVEAWEYTIEGGPSGGIATSALTEQAGDDPAAIARNQLIRYRDEQATIKALTARK